MQKVLITGGSGFCARHLTRRLAKEDNIQIIGLDLTKSPPTDIPLDDYISADVSNQVQVENAIHKIRPDIIYHLAGLAGGSAADIYRVNFMGGVCLLESIVEFSPDVRVLLVGSASEYGYVTEAEMPVTEEHPCNPSGAYGLSKYALTMVAMDYYRNLNLKVAVARPFNIIGEGVSSSLVVGAVLKRAKMALADNSDPVVTVGNLDTERDFISVEDAVEGYLKLMQGEHWGEVFNICSGKPRTIRSVIEQLLSHSKRPVRLEVDPALIRTSDIQTIYGSWEKANRAFGFIPKTSLEDSLKDAWNHTIGRMN